MQQEYQDEREMIQPEGGQCQMCPMDRVRAGVVVRIKKLCTPPETQTRLREMGLGEEKIIKILTSQTNCICQVCHARLAIGSQLAQMILVEPVFATAGV